MPPSPTRDMPLRHRKYTAVKINDRRGRTLTIVFVGGPREGTLSSLTEEAEANMVWLLTNYGRSGSEFIRVSPALPDSDSDVLDKFPPVEAHRYRVVERAETELDVRLLCRYKNQV